MGGTQQGNIWRAVLATACERRSVMVLQETVFVAPCAIGCREGTSSIVTRKNFALHRVWNMPTVASLYCFAPTFG